AFPIPYIPDDAEVTGIQLFYTIRQETPVSENWRFKPRIKRLESSISAPSSLSDLFNSTSFGGNGDIQILNFGQNIITKKEVIPLSTPFFAGNGLNREYYLVVDIEHISGSVNALSVWLHGASIVWEYINVKL